MAKAKPGSEEALLSRQKLIELLNEDLSREYQAIIAYVVYSQVLKGAAYMSIAKELEVHAGECVGLVEPVWELTRVRSELAELAGYVDLGEADRRKAAEVP